MTRHSVVVPVYKNSGNIQPLLAALAELNSKLDGTLEAVFVVDGSPDDSYEKLRDLLPGTQFASKLLLLSRNFGSFAAVREGLRAATGPFFAVMAADLQEPPDLVRTFFSTLADEPLDVVYGERESRSDPLGSRLAASVFWALYRRLVQPEVPPGGVDIFGCNREFRDRLLELEESNSSLVGLIFWMGFRRKGIPYTRQPRLIGKSAWTFGRKLKYLSDSVFAFSNLPIRLLTFAGALGLLTSTSVGSVVLTAKLLGWIDVPGYAATVLTVMFFGALNSFGLGIIGSYVWRTFENTKQRPLAIVMHAHAFAAARGEMREETV